MRVLILGSGAKDHAVAWWFSRSCYISALYIAPGNLATARFATNLPSVNPSDPADVYEACTVYNIDFVFIGTEAPLFTGVVQYLTDRGIRTFGAPTRSLKLEGDRSFSRAFMARHNIPVPKGIFFDSEEPLERYLDRHEGTTFIIKSNLMTPSRIMLTVVIALLPTTLFGIYNFGPKAALLTVISIASAVLTEFLFEKICKKKVTVGDLSAVVTGLLLALNLPVSVPWWIPVVGSVFAILVVKMLFGGLGQNFMNPALAGRCFLLISFSPSSSCNK